MRADETGRLMLTLPKERLAELKQLAADSGITLTQAAAQCVSVGLIHLQAVVSPTALLRRPEFRSWVQEMVEKKEVVPVQVESSPVEKKLTVRKSTKK